ncbi:hypothetical protein H6P81_004899 [Aristolochia fimbriata]|uniref:Protein MON2 homolog n=1 Tax=Aristolochia fimbriata TaxID=158543 RepID=A0AAV7ESY9_ARIFI|nr:hypothetical protein H6P81_004899 [Aristolochia fimbriata]
MAFMAALESDLRALSAEARRRYPAVKDAAEHAILKLRSLSSPSEIAQNEDILQIFLMACDVKTVKMSVIGLSSLQKLISHNAVSPAVFREILLTLKDHSEMPDESVQLKTLQTLLIMFQFLLPENEDNVAQALGICLRLLENNRSSDSVRNTAAATFRQAVALIFDHVVSVESLPAGKVASSNHMSRTSTVSDDVSRSITVSMGNDLASGGPSCLRKTLSKAGKLGLCLLEDLTALAAGGFAVWLRVHSLQRTFALDIVEFILSSYVSVFKNLLPYEQILRHQICSLLMTSLRTNAEVEGEAGEPSFRRLVLRSVAHVIRLYNVSLVTECEVFLNMLLKVTALDLPLWHRILVLEILRGFCVEARTLRLLFLNFDMHPKNTNVVENMVKALARVVSSIQIPDSSEESLAAVAGMFNSKAKGIEWSLDNDAPNAAVLVASEAHAITLAVEGLLGVVFTVATLTDEAVDAGEIESPRCDSDSPAKCTGQTVTLCVSMVDSLWLTILDALSLILTRSQGEAIVLEILKGYQAFTQACGVLRAVEPLNSFLASLCKFTISFPNEPEKKSILLSPASKRSEVLVDQRDNVVLTPKKVQALRTLFNIAHRLHNVLGPSWVLVLDTLAALDRAIHSPHATTQEVSSAVPRLMRDTSGQFSDFNILSSLNSQLFESSALMHISAVKALLSALCQLSHQYACGNLSGVGQASTQQTGNVTFSVERMTSVLKNNLHRVEPLWDQVVSHLLELSENSNPQIRNLALDALDQSICAVLESHQFLDATTEFKDSNMEPMDKKLQSFECAVISPLAVLYSSSSQNLDVRIASLKILLNVLGRHGDKLCHSWPNILEMLRSVASASEKDLIPLGFQCVRVIMNDGLSTIPADCIDVCIEVTGAYSGQKTDLNISLTAIGLLWTATDFIAKGLLIVQNEEKDAGWSKQGKEVKDDKTAVGFEEVNDRVFLITTTDRVRLLFLVFSILKKLGADERPEVRNSAIRTLFQTLGSHGQKLSSSMWEDCLWRYVFPILDSVNHLAETSSRDEWQGKELGVRGGKAVHMLIHHSRNTAQKQWDETLVLVLGGITRILRSFFPLLLGLNNFLAGWESLLTFVRNSITNGSKEVALAAINCLQTAIVSHCTKGSLPISYLKSVLSVYEFVLQNPLNHKSNAADKVKQEILHGLGDLYVQAQAMFDERMYLQLLDLIKLAVRQPKSTKNNLDIELGTIPLVHRTMLEILPLLRPVEKLSSMWPHLLKELISYLPRLDPTFHETEIPERTISEENDAIQVGISGQEINALNGTLSHTRREEDPFKSSASGFGNDAPASYIFAQKLIPVLVDLFILAPAAEKLIVFPDIIQALGRCMSTRRDNPDGPLWRLSVQGFNRLLVDDVNRLNFDSGTVQATSRPARIRLWKEIADTCEIFLVGSCGHALPSNALSAEDLEADECLEMSILNVLGEHMLKSKIDAPVDILQRLILTLDRCASRTSCLPVETVGLMPPHCSRFSLACLEKIFSLCSYSQEDDWHLTRTEVSKIAIMVLMNRCECIMKQFLIDEAGLGGKPLPVVRTEEMVFVLKELARLLIHSETVAALPLQPYLKEGLTKKDSHDNRAHLIVLLPAFSEVINSGEPRPRELTQV